MFVLEFRTLNYMSEKECANIPDSPKNGPVEKIQNGIIPDLWSENAG